MKLPITITDRIDRASEKEITTIQSLANAAKALQSTRDSQWKKYEALKDKEPIAAGLLARALNSHGAAMDEARGRFFLAQIICLLGGGIQRGKVHDSEVFDSQGDKGDAEWTARARATVAEIDAYLSRHHAAA